MEPKERVKLLDELMTVVQVMDEMYQYHPENPNQVDVVSEFKALAERKAHFATPPAQVFAGGSQLFIPHAVLALEMLGTVFTLWAHVRVQLKRLKAQLHLHRILHALQGLLQGVEAHGAPGAGHIRHKVDLQGCQRVLVTHPNLCK